MCGIAGYIDLGGHQTPNNLASIITAMCDSMVHRGPDDSGIWVDAEAGIALGHRRLSIIDLRPEGRQPMGGHGVNTLVTYNGEVYNFEAIRERMKRAGRRFRSRSDTEILPHLFENLDPGALGRLNGMFAFGVWHKGTHELLLARDAYGKKPLYIYEDGNTFAFASEMQAFYAIPGFKADIDRSALAEYLLLGYLPAPKTIYSHIRMLDAGSFEKIALRDGKVRVTDSGRFFRFNAYESRSTSGLDRRVIREKIRDRLVTAVDQRMISDVPLGAFLSGGVDSALVVSIVRNELNRDIDTFSIGFEGSPESEHLDARAIAEHLGTRHHDKMLNPDVLALIDKIAGILDQPNGDSSCLPTYLLSQFAREKVTVILSGDGGDELFGGYGRYRDTLNEWNNPDLIRQVHGFDPETTEPADLYMSLRWHIWLPQHVEGFLGSMPDDVQEKVKTWRSALNDKAVPVMHRMRSIDANLYMPGAVLAKVDRMSMQHSLEVRSPLLDPGISEIAMGLRDDDCWIAPDVTKSILKEVACEYLPREWMYRSKKGFGLPSNAWSQDNIIELCKQTLTRSDTMLNAHMDTRYLRDIVQLQSQPNQFSIYQMWPLLILEMWMQKQPAKIAAAQETRRAA